MTIRPLKKRTIYCPHGWSFNRNISSIRKIALKGIEAVLSLGCKKIINISNSEDVSSGFIPSSKREMIYNSIPDISRKIDTSKSENSSKIKLLFVGRLDEQKGIDLLLSALNTESSQKKFELTVIGNSVLNDYHDKGLYKHVHFLGWRNEEYITQSLSQNDVLVIPSRWEGFGLVCLEAMRSKKMVLASDAGALPEIVIDKETGITFKSESVEALSSALMQLTAMSTDSIHQMGEAGRKRFETYFNYNDMLKKLKQVYLEVSH